MNTDVLQSGMFTVTESGQQASLRVVGVGGAGCKAALQVQSRLRTAVGMICIDTDSTSLTGAVPGESLLLGAAELRGFGSGCDQEAARKAAESERDGIRELVSGADCVLVLAGLSGGTGSAAAPVVASVAKEAGALVVSGVFMPFEFEGIGKHLHAADALDRLRDISDAVLEAPGSGQANGSSTLTDAIEQDRRFVTGFASVITSITSAIPAQSSLTSAHLRSVLRDGAATLFGSGEGYGHTGAVEAAQVCVDTALANSPASGDVDRAVVLIESGPELSISQVATAVATIETRIGSNVELQLGVRRSRLLSGEVRISLIGTQRRSRRPIVFDSRSTTGRPLEPVRRTRAAYHHLAVG